MRPSLHATSAHASSLQASTQHVDHRLACRCPGLHRCPEIAKQVARPQAVLRVNAPRALNSPVPAEQDQQQLVQLVYPQHQQPQQCLQNHNGNSSGHSTGDQHIAWPSQDSSPTDNEPANSMDNVAAIQQLQIQQQPAVTETLVTSCAELLASGRCHQADSLLWSAIMQLRTLKQLQAAYDTITAASFMRPAVVVALLVQLGKLVTKQQRRQHQLAEQRLQREQHASELNRLRQLQRQRHKTEQKERERLEQVQARAMAMEQAIQTLHERLQHPSLSPLQQQRLGAALKQRRQELKQLQSREGNRQQQLAASMESHSLQQSKTLQEQKAAVSARSSQAASAAKLAAAQQSPLYVIEQQQRLLRRLLQHIKATDTTAYTPFQLGILPHWLAKLGVSDVELLTRLQEAARSQVVHGSAAGRLVPMLWGFAKNAAGTAESKSKASRAGTQQQQQRLASDVLPCQQQPQQPVPSNASTGYTVPDAAFVSTWLEASTPNLHSFSFSQLASSIYSLALLRHNPPQPWVDAFFAATQQQMQSATAHDLSNVLWALGTLHISPPDAVAAADDVEAIDSAARAAAAASAAAAAAGQGSTSSAPAAPANVEPEGLSSSNSSWWGQFQVAAVAVLWSFTGVGIANLIWGAAKINLQPAPQVAHLLLWQAHRQFCSMDLQLAVSCVWGVARLQLKPSLHWLHRFSRRVRQLAPSSITPGLAASLLVSFGLLHYCPKAWMRRFLQTLSPQLPNFTPQDVANTFTAFAHMQYVPIDDWLFDFHMQARAVLPQCGPRELVPIAHALSVLANNVASYRVEPDMLAALAARCRATAAQFTTEDCANLARSIVYLKAAPGVGLLAGMAGAFTTNIHTASVSDVAGMLWALGAWWRSSNECMWLRQNPQVVQQLVSRSQEYMQQFGPLQLQRVLAAVAAMGINPGQQWLAAHEAAVVVRLPDLYASTLEQVLWCYRGLGYKPRQLQLLQQALAEKQETQQHRQQQ